ncbi:MULTISPECIES: flagellin [unclassified Thermosipho (in: thermotogales)]|uniref:flagellin n=1 Tax=unclassified Thermosipho (in: thermotogales) TaxID=2676525 RepID=UPI00098443EA|nr:MULTISPECIES: flagellin [unclassified Thermosipho (in: thermotogales)]MBT1247305.1 hypothetical protein [Thermosipho sp. 1244]OOC47033.1 hypothetical protein XO09_03580 [Thermosipho sp. 1223]
MRINNNINLWITHRLLSIQNQNRSNLAEVSGAQKLLTSDISGATIYERMKSQIEGYGKVIENIYSGVDMLNLADSSLSSIQENLQRMRELAVQASNGTLTENERSALNEEYNQLLNQINDTIKNTQFNNKQLLNGEIENLKITINPNGKSESITIPDVTPTTLEGSNLLSVENAQSTLKKIDDITSNISNIRSKIGTHINSLKQHGSVAASALENITSSASIIHDTDIAKTLLEITKNNILTQNLLSLSTQSNVSAWSVLRLLG